MSKLSVEERNERAKRIFWIFILSMVSFVAIYDSYEMYKLARPWLPQLIDGILFLTTLVSIVFKHKSAPYLITSIITNNVLRTIKISSNQYTEIGLSLCVFATMFIFLVFFIKCKISSKKKDVL